ncbi:hypothetical protein CQW23_35221 [Capsicum baccatum]|uniref:Uncharacterized protein n=1 Tax=Capsicum baccatum TaxID=33114 RepID=A0A2G2UWJ8_CAPBA|nr:hypothetical protein CQW23_35221 [Capsicum baccatum]
MIRQRQCGADRISELSEEILHHTLSFLEVKDGAVMGEVSTTWNRAWNSLSSLNFGNSYFLNRLDWTRRIIYITHLLAIRQTHNICIQSFHLRLPYLPFWNPEIQNMLTALVACNVKALYFTMNTGLTTIQLGETLSKLKKVEFSACPPEFDEVDIRAPNLVDLEMYQLTSHLKVFNITACKALTSLLLSDMIITEKWLEHVSCLPELQRLHLIKCKTLNTIDISSVSIQHLVLHDFSLITVKLDTTNLKYFSYRSSSFPTLKLKAPASLQPKIAFDSKSPDSDWYSKLLIFLANFSHYRAVELSSENDEVIIIPNDVRESLVPPLYGTDRLHVKFQNKLKYSVVDIVDSLLWISPQLDTLSFHQADLKTLKFIYEDAFDEDEKPYCTSLTWKCWRHKLKISSNVTISYLFCEVHNRRYPTFPNNASSP